LPYQDVEQKQVRSIVEPQEQFQWRVEQKQVRSIVELQEQFQ